MSTLDRDAIRQRAATWFRPGTQHPVERDVLDLLDEVERLTELAAVLECGEPFSYDDCRPDCECPHGGPRSCGCHVTGAEAREWIRQRDVEVDRLRAALADEQAAHAKTFDNFDAFIDSSGEERERLRWQLEDAHRDATRARQAFTELLNTGAVSTGDGTQHEVSR